jgi:small subunit ribosomal protein S4e
LISDVISIDKTGENFRLIYDTKGRFAVHRITPEEAKVGVASGLGSFL